MDCLNCFKCYQALFLRDADGNMCLSSVYCAIKGEIVELVDIDDCSEYKGVT